MRKKLLLVASATILLFLSTKQNVSAQSGVAINNTGSAPDPSAILDVKSSNKGFLPPRMTTAERNAIASPATGLSVYQTDGSPGYYYFNGSVWAQLGTSSVGSCQSLIPMPSYPVSSGGSKNISSNTTVSIGQVTIPLQITVSQITIICILVNNPGSIKLALYSEDGQVKIMETLTNIISAGVITTILSTPVTINPGHYYISVLPIGTTNINIEAYGSGITSTQYLHLSGKNVLVGTLTVPPDTFPANINPVIITYSDFNCASLRIN